MNADWKQIREVFERAFDLEPAERAAFLDEACGDDAAVRREVEALLAAHVRTGEFMSAPPEVSTALWKESGPREDDRHLPVGTVVDGKYKVEALLGEGGMGAVYRVLHLQLDRRVALKIIRGDLIANRSTVERFRREAVAVARLRHQHIVTLHDYGVVEGSGAYLVMELLEGRSLREELAERKRLEARSVLEWMRQVCEAVGAAHKAGVVHRDLKPENIFLEKGKHDRGSPATTVKVLDFGLAKLGASFRSAGALTTQGAILGTPAYMSPEQCRGDEVDVRSDVYALGCVLYEMLTGEPPFRGPNAMALVFKHVHEAPRPPSELLPGLAPTLDKVLARALAKAPEERFQSVEELARTLAVVGASVGPESGSRNREDTLTAGGSTGESPKATSAIDRVRTGETKGPSNNLPQPITAFVGREQQIGDVLRLLGSSRLVTLVGPGGIGKTRLALEVAARVRGEWDGGVWLVELASLAEPSLVTHAVASALGVREQSDRPETEALEAWLRDRRALLVLDNCEHLVEACAMVAETLLASCSELHVLGTSREALGVAGEAIWPVPPLEIPALDAKGELESEAVRLFVERASFAKPGFEATAQARPLIAAVCRKLEGIPLAIELAAARTKVLSVEQILERLDDRFRLLAGGSRTSPSRQQTLRATLDWSYDLLTEEERALLQRLSVFAGGWSLEAAEAACGDETGVAGDRGTRNEESQTSSVPRSEVLHHLERLVDKSLVVFECHHEPRYTALEIIRQYAAEKLRESGEWEYYRTRHCDWFVRFATEAYETYGTQVGEHWLTRLDIEQDNLRSALQWSVERGDGEAALGLCCGLMRLWDMRGGSTQGRAWFDRALAIGAEAPSALRSRALHNAGTLAQNQGDYDRATELYAESLAGRRASGDTQGAAQNLRRMGDVALRRGHYDEAEASYAESLMLYRSVDHQLGAGLALGQLGMVALARDDPERAAAWYGESLEVLRRLGHKLMVAITLHNLGEVEHRLGNLDRAVALVDEALELAREAEYKGLIAMSLAVLSAIATDTGDFVRAADGSARALAMFDEIGDKLGVATALERAACTAAAAGRAERALRLLGAASSLRETMGSVLTPLESTYLERYAATAREALSAEDAERAFDAGRATASTDAIAYGKESPFIE